MTTSYRVATAVFWCFAVVLVSGLYGMNVSPLGFALIAGVLLVAVLVTVRVWLGHR